MKLKDKKIKKKTKSLIKKGREGTTVIYSLPEIIDTNYEQKKSSKN